MKSHVILFIATLMLVRPLWPIAEYVMNYDYIVNVLCENKNRPELQCDGKRYLAKQLAKESERGDKNPFGENRSKTEIHQIVFFKPLHQMDFPIGFQNKALDNLKTSRAFISTLLISDISHPPEVA